ncbi:MAG: inositol monophosphatase [Bacteroidetes bacterium]|nr:inositol monophosphatase [Bacteroidota bacterium]
MPAPPTDSTAYARELAVAEEAARAAGAFIRTHVGGIGDAAVRDKGIHDLVTFVDEEAERIIVRHLKDAFPKDDFLGEETASDDTRHEVEGRRWIVDPLDGTTNFIHGVPPYAVSIALQDDADLVIGVVYDVPYDELFAAEAGCGLTLNGEPAAVSDTADIGDALLATGFPFRDYGFVEGYVKTLAGFMRSARGVRRHGAAAVDLAWVACGRFDGFFEAGLAPWDLAAGVVLIKAAGGRVSGLPGGSNPVFDGGIVASNSLLHGPLEAGARPLGRAYAALKAVHTTSSANRRDQSTQ